MTYTTLHMASASLPRLQEGGGDGAQQTLPLSLREISRSWNQTHTLFPLSWLMVSLGAALAIMAVAVWLRKRRQRIDTPSASDLWRSFAERAGLGFRDRRLLERISRQQRLPSPLTLLVCRATFDHHAARYAEQSGASGPDELRRRVTSLRQRLFETGSPPREA